MIYEEPEFHPGGDRNLLMYLGDEMSFDLNFLVHSVAQLIREQDMKGVIELIPEMASILVSYDADQISYADLCGELRAIRGSIGVLEGLELDSRIFYVPVLYFDPWTKACVEDYRANLAEKEADPELLIRLNELRDRNHLKRVHSGTEYWVAALGFLAGALFAVATRSTMLADGSEVQSAQDLDARGHHWGRRCHHLYLSRPHAGGLPDLRPLPDADLGPGSEARGLQG